MKFDRLPQFLHFLQDELQVPDDAIALAMRQEAPFLNVLPMLLWQYGSIDLSQLERIFEWLDL
ncbi:MAG: DUF2949 domain-containing protein [Geitlerinemataceae cyanobacterium]